MILLGIWAHHLWSSVIAIIDIINPCASASASDTELHHDAKSMRNMLHIPTVIGCIFPKCTNTTFTTSLRHTFFTLTYNAHFSRHFAFYPPRPSCCPSGAAFAAAACLDTRAPCDPTHRSSCTRGCRGCCPSCSASHFAISICELALASRSFIASTRHNAHGGSPHCCFST